MPDGPRFPLPGFGNRRFGAYRREVATPSPLLSLPVLQADLGRVEEQLRTSVRSDDPFLTEVASHLITAGGKRVRPGFAIASAGTLHTDLEPATADVVMGSVAVELVHLGSLYHDDVMDDATTRRTVESVNARWGNLKAILAGDYLLAKASEIAASLGTEVAGLLAATIGRLCEGQVLELQHTFDLGRTEAAYLTSIDGKTASLLATACRIGAITGGHDRDRIDALTTFGHGFGMAFQIVDDILDLVATDEQLGKPAGHDLVEGTYTLPVLRTLAAGGPAAVELAHLLEGPLGTDDLAAARTIVRTSGQVETSLDTAADYAHRAAASLAPFNGGQAAGALAAAAEHLLETVRLVSVGT